MIVPVTLNSFLLVGWELEGGYTILPKKVDEEVTKNVKWGLNTENSVAFVVYDPTNRDYHVVYTQKARGALWFEYVYPLQDYDEPSYLQYSSPSSPFKIWFSRSSVTYHFGNQNISYLTIILFPRRREGHILLGKTRKIAVPVLQLLRVLSLFYGFSVKLGLSGELHIGGIQASGAFRLLREKGLIKRGFENIVFSGIGKKPDGGNIMIFSEITEGEDYDEVLELYGVELKLKRTLTVDPAELT